MDVEWLDNDDELAAALEIHEQQQEAEDNETGTADVSYRDFDPETGHSWIYPNNLPPRSYQRAIVQSAIFKNTLVVLPTGLGKTFIAAVLMFNFYRWFPRGKIIFMAPTRPLVAQQIQACQKIMPFAPTDTVQLTGQITKAKRADLWASKRVFFATPQVVHSDMLEPDVFPFADVRLVVVDEAHRAKGRYSYTQVADSLIARNRHFRMLALSATPGRTMEDVASVCQNLYIANVQVRWDTSIDVQPYVHRRTIRTMVVSLKERIKEPRERLLQIVEPYLRQLVEADIIKGNRGNLSKNSLIYEQKVFLDRSSRGQRHPEHNIITGNFAMCISLYHSLELMERHGLRVFVNNFDADEEGREKFVLARDRDLRDLVEQVRQGLGPNPLDYPTNPMMNGVVPPLPADLDFGHAKYEKLREVLVAHFTAHADSRAIVFCEYRESVMLIHRLLLQHRPLLRPRCFVGQGVSGGASHALTQKQQLQIMADFRSGTSNVLVATSIGEEGLDVGEVEMIVCFDICSSNPTRFVQRIGRTGRKKNGEVVMLVTEGREQQVLKDVLANKDQINRKILNSSAVQLSLYKDNPRMVPNQFQPKCEEKHMESSVVEEKPKKGAKKKEPRKRKEPPAQTNTIRKFFKESAPTESQLEMRPHQMSEASQTMLKQQVARRSGSVKSFFEETQAKATVSSSQEEVQRLRKLTRLLQSTKSIIPDAHDLIGHLQDDQLPRPLKLYLLQSNPEFVKETHTKMLLQNQLDIPEDRLNNRQQRTRNNYKLMLDICDGPEQLEELLEADQSLAEITMKDLEDPLDKQRERMFVATCDKIFAGLDEQGLNADNYELKQQLLERLELRNLEATVAEQLGGEETSWEEDMQLEEPLEERCESMYLSQRLDFAPSGSLQNSSTPLRIKPPRKMEFEPLPEEDDDYSRVEASDLGDNLSRLNNLMNTSLNKVESVAKTSPKPDPWPAESGIFPLSEDESPKKPEPSPDHKTKDVESTPEDLELDLNDFLEPMNEEVALTCNQKDKNSKKPILEEPKPKQKECKVVEEAIFDDFDDFLQPMDEEIALISQQKTKSPEPKAVEERKQDHVISILDDLDDFLEPMAEEVELTSQLNKDKSKPKAEAEAKENNPQLLQLPSCSGIRNRSPDIFDSDSLSPLKPQVKSLAAKLAAKTAAKPLPPAPTTSNNLLQSPKNRQRTNPLNQEKSPSIFDLYLNRMRGRGRLAKAAESLHRQTSAITPVPLPKEQEEDSPIVRRSSKRKLIISSDDEDDAGDANPSVINCDTDDEQIPDTQMPDTPTPPPKPRRKLANYNSFIMDEAEISGSDHEEEAEHTIGAYLKDSVIVSSDEDDHNDTNMHAMYLQAIKSPINRPGAFKMPAPRVYRNDSQIFSQAVETDASQYLPSSFIVADESSETGHDVSECPLEKAERILKERRRQRRRGQLPPADPPPNKRRRVQMLSTSSDEDDEIFLK
ncbi:hypothetical protein KR018_009217 [Drosophila ironensis]|nr:hypothetical protein KR018_009217 [Drosophila ironensis]